MFTEFDELCAIGRIMELYGDRSRSVTENQVRRLARKISREMDIGIENAYDEIEDRLLSKNPSPENWS